MALFFCRPQDRLDPIDWATYEPYFWGNVQRHMQRTSILFGTLMQLQRNTQAAGETTAGYKAPAGGGGGGAGTSANMADSNPLNLMPVAPRFQYLPISAPSVGGPAASGLTASGGGRLIAGGGAMLLAGIAPQAGAGGGLDSSSAARSGDMAGQFSFADLGTRAARGGAAGEGGVSGSAAGGGGGIGEAATAGMAAGASALSAFQARLQAGLGTMLGGSDLTAMAQQRLGDNIADFTALGSGLLGSTGLFAKTKQ